MIPKQISQEAREAADIIERIKADPGHPAERSTPEIIQAAIDRASAEIWYSREGKSILGDHELDLFHPIESAPAAPAVQWPAPIAFADRHPTEADFNADGYILVWLGNRWGYATGKSDIVTHWLPQPPAPISAEDAAFEEELRRYENAHSFCKISDVARHFWNASREFQRKEAGK